MNSMIDTILNKIDHGKVLSMESVRFQNKHIFDDLVSNFKSDMDKATLMGLYYYMSISEKTLNHYRRREFFQANQNYETLESLENLFVAPVKDGMCNLHMALTSYKNYVDGKYDLALLQLDQSIDFAIKQSKTFPYFINVIGEQWLNKIRVYCKIKDFDAVLRESYLLNQFLIYGIHQDEFVERCCLQVPLSHRNQMLIHVTNSIDSAVAKSFAQTDDFYRILSEKIIAKTGQTPQDDAIEKAYEVLFLLSEGEDRFLKGITDNFESLKKVPYALQKNIFSSFVSICDSYDYDFSMHENSSHIFETFKYLTINFKSSLV